MIYDFNNLKEFVKLHLGVDPDGISSKFLPITEKLTRAELDKSVEIDFSGIFFIDRQGNKHKGFLYIESGYSQRTIDKVGTSIPRFHVVNCETIQAQKQRHNFNGHYVFSNEVVKMEDRVDAIVKDLLICGNCIKQFAGVQKGMTTSQFKEKIILADQIDDNFFDSELPKEVSTNFWGYTHDWDLTSKNYRMKKNFTCEECGINLNTNLVNGYFLETHHIDGNPKNNNEGNLKCLCVLCHAYINQFHIQNYSKGAGRLKLIDFLKLFGDQLASLRNPHFNKLRDK